MMMKNKKTKYLCNEQKEKKKEHRKQQKYVKYIKQTNRHRIMGRKQKKEAEYQ